MLSDDKPFTKFLFLVKNWQTLTVHLCAEMVTKWANINFHQEPVFCHISMATRHSILDHKSHLVRSIRRTIALALEIDENSRLFAIEKELEKQALILVIDEVDILFEEYGGIGETLFNNLVNMAAADHPRFTLIAISKSKNDDQCSSPLRDHHHVSIFRNCTRIHFYISCRNECSHDRILSSFLFDSMNRPVNLFFPPTPRQI